MGTSKTNGKNIKNGLKNMQLWADRKANMTPERIEAKKQAQARWLKKQKEQKEPEELREYRRQAQEKWRAKQPPKPKKERERKPQEPKERAKRSKKLSIEEKIRRQLEREAKRNEKAQAKEAEKLRLKAEKRMIKAEKAVGGYTPIQDDEDDKIVIKPLTKGLAAIKELLGA